MARFRLSGPVRKSVGTILLLVSGSGCFRVTTAMFGVPLLGTNALQTGTPPVTSAPPITGTTSALAPIVALGDVPGFENGNTLTDPNLTRLKQDGNEVNRKYSFMVGYVAWAGNDGYLPFSPVEPTLQALNDAGYGVVLTWAAQNWQVSGAVDPNFNYSAILSGKHDAYIQQWAQAAAAWGKVLYLRLFHEMNGDWYPWGINVNGNTPALHIQAWQHVHNIFKQAGATNVKFLWCPNARSPVWSDSDPLATYFPGSAYVGWLGMDGYNWGLYGEQNWGGSWYTFTQIFQPTYNEMQTTVSSDLPVMIAETASNPGALATDKAGWITEMRDAVPSLFPNVKALAYYNTDLPPSQILKVDDDSPSLGAFTILATDPRWQASLPN